MARGEGTKKVSDLFEKYKKTLRAPQGSVINSFCEVVEDLYGWHINAKHVSYNVHTRTLHTKLPSLYQTEFRLKKTEILSHLIGRLGEQSAPKEII